MTDWNHGMSSPLQGTASAAGAIERVKYTHDALIDVIIQNPTIKQKDLAEHFGYTQAWLSRIMNSDAFLARLAERKKDIVDPSLTLSVEEKLRALADKSLDVVMEKLELSRSPDLGIKALEMTTKALGYGARPANVAIQQNFVVPMPQKAPSADAWAQKYAGGGLEAGPQKALPQDPPTPTTIENPELVRVVQGD